GANVAAILVEGHIAHVMQPVLDSPMTARQLKQTPGTGLGSGQAGDDIGGLPACLSAYFAGAFDAPNLGGTGTLEMRDYLGADRDPAGFNTSVLLVNGFRHLQIGRQNGWACRGKAPRSFRRCWLLAPAGCPSPQTGNRLFPPR